MTEAASLARERNRPLRVVVSTAERALIEANAKDAGLSVSSYLRLLGIGHEPQSTFDREAVGQLAKITCDQGRLGGLLKLWLAEKPGEGASEIVVARLMEDLNKLVGELRAQVRRL
jgi:hypothetical protein